MEKISIILPVYNSEKFIKKCIESIINQTYKNIEIICVNDGSDDNSLNILKNYQKKDSRIIIINKKNAGVSAARNDAIKLSKGKYITFIDADDWYEPNAIENLYNSIKQNNVDVVRGNYYITESNGKSYVTSNLFGLNNKILKTSDRNFADSVINRFLNGDLPCYVWLLFIKREVILNIRFKENIKIMEDTIFYNELMNNIDTIYFLEKPLYHYFYNENSCTKSKKYYVRNMYSLLEVNEYLTDIIKKSKFYSEERIEKMNFTHINLILNYFFMMYKESLKDKKELVSEIKKILSNKKVKKLLLSINLRELPLHLRLCAKSIINGEYKKLFVLYKIRLYLSILKKKVNRK